MAKTSNARRSSRRPATSLQARENELSAAAYDLAEDQIKSGTASSQVITHFLKMGSSREQKEQMRMDHEIHLMEVKAEQLEGQKRVEALYVGALEAMRGYSGQELPAGDSVDGEFTEER